MKNSVRLAAIALMATLMGVVTQGHAFTLGDLRGSAVLGRTLDVSVQVQAGPGEDLTAACMAVELLYADVRQSAPRISVAPLASGQSAVVRVQSSNIVNEPVVTVTLHATCGSSVMRRYVLLADLPQLKADVPALASATGAWLAPPVLVLSPQLAPVPSDSDPAAAKPTRAARPATAAAQAVKRTAKPHKADAIEAGVAAVRKTAVRPAGKAVLKLDPLDMLSDRIDLLDSHMLFAPTEDALRQTREITSLQGDVKTLREQAAKNDARLAEVQARLQQAQQQQQQFPVWLLYALAALVLLCLGALVWLWRQQRRAPASGVPQESWWHGPDSPPSTILMPRSQQEPAVVAAAPPVVKEVPAALATAALPARSEVDLDLDIDLSNFMMMELSPEQSPATLAPPDVSTDRIHRIHRISLGTILDTRQQAEFFVSLGQTERALRILRKQINESFEANPFVYLDLLALCHSLGMRADFHQCRVVFNQKFNCVAPDFSEFTREGQDLQAYPDMLTRLAQDWPGSKALAYLDDCIFHDPNAPVSTRFDLAAFRDLLTLHALAEELGYPGETLPADFPSRPSQLTPDWP